LTKRVSEAISQLLRKEAELAKVEVADKARVMAMGAGLVVGAAVVGLAALGAITAAAILALATTIAAWLAALIVGLVLVAMAGVLVLVGVKRLRRATPPVPVETVDSVKEDIEWVKTSAKSGMR
jgi:tetrahydromethanopterin S-methyltransferase subunit C